VSCSAGATGRRGESGPSTGKAAQKREREEASLSQFGRMCQKPGIEWIGASSPQAKGRVERTHLKGAGVGRRLDGTLPL